MTSLPRARRSTLDIGSAFEKHALRFCNHHLHMSLRGVGGAGDGGVDLRGHWWIPSDCRPSSSRLPPGGTEGGGSRRLRVVAQCKAERKALGPRAIREFEGVIAHLQGASRKGKEHESELHDTAIALMLSQSGFSKNAMAHAVKSHCPMLLLHLPGGQPLALEDDSEPDTEASEDEPGMVVDGAWWNNALSVGVLGGKMELRREILGGSARDPLTGELKVKTRIGLWHNGRRLHRMGRDSTDDI